MRIFAYYSAKYQPGEPQPGKLKENELTEGNHRKLRENYEYCCFA